MIQHISADKRIQKDFGWLKANWLFSFGDVHQPGNLQHGKLRVWNDDEVRAGKGFDTHPHANMEIVTIVLQGSISHEDSMGNKTTIKAGEVQRMSAGSGVYHSEYNKGDETLYLYQIWIFPHTQGLKPEYEQKRISWQETPNKLIKLVCNDDDDALSIHQDAAILAAVFHKGGTTSLANQQARKLTLYLRKGKLEVNGQSLEQNEQLRIADVEKIDIIAQEDSELFVVDTN